MRHLQYYGSLFRFLIHILLSLKQIVIIETVAIAFEHVPISRENENLFAGSVCICFPKSKKVVCLPVPRLRKIKIKFFLLFMLLELHVREDLRKIKVYFVNILERLSVLAVDVLRFELVHGVKYQVLEDGIAGRVAC